MKTDPAVQHVPIAKRRTYLTHVAFVCDDPAIQPLLPQVAIGNERTIKARQLVALRATCPANIRIFRRKSAWVDAPLIAQIVRWLALDLAAFMEEFQVVLLFDACKAHLHACVFAACAAARIWAVVVPAKMTRLLQPLDTHIFLAYKIYLQKAYQAARVRSASGDLDVAGLLECIRDGVVSIFHDRQWSTAFDADGFTPGQTALRASIMTELELAAPPVIPATRPSLEQVSHCFPMRSRIPLASIWRPFDPPVVVGDAPKAAPAMLRRSVRLAALALPPPASRGAAPRPARPSSLLGARPKAAAACAAPKVAAPRAVAPKAVVAPPFPKAAAPGGILTRSRSRALGFPCPHAG